MAQCIIFKTPGLIDTRAFTIVGLSSKPNSDSPIGRFGSGLKYAIATLVRNKIGVKVFIGNVEYVFYANEDDFRGQQYHQIYMRRTEVSLLDRIRGKSEHIQLPFTTEWGRNWELWQAYRELEANTRDEGGSTFKSSFEDVDISGESGWTHIVVYGPKFAAEYANRDRTFLPDGLVARGFENGIQIIDRPSQHIYYRSMRVMDLPKEKPSLLTYNFLDEIDLTEDRTAKNPWQLELQIQALLVQSKDEEQIKKVVAAPKGTFEEGFTYEYLYSAPSKVFTETVKEAAPESKARSFTKTYEPRKVIPDPFAAHPRPWQLSGNGAILDGNETCVMVFDQWSTLEGLHDHVLKAINNYKPTGDE